jgi:hypothetical protein
MGYYKNKNDKKSINKRSPKLQYVIWGFYIFQVAIYSTTTLSVLAITTMQ